MTGKPSNGHFGKRMGGKGPAKTRIALAAAMILAIVTIWPHLGGTKATAAATPKHTSALATASTPTAASHQAWLVEQSFAATHATPTGYLLHSWNLVSKSFESDTAMNGFIDRLKQDLSLHAAKILSYHSQYETFFKVTGTWADGTSVSATLARFYPVSGASVTALTIRANNLSGRLDGLSTGIAQIHKALSELDLSSEINACVEGFVNARMSDVQREQLVSRVFAAVQARRVEALNSELITSVSGYSPIGDTYILTNQHPMNLQIALHYDENRHHTNVLVGSPIITVAY